MELSPSCLQEDRRTDRAGRMRRPERRDRFQPVSIQGTPPWRTVTETWEEAENRAYDGLMTGGAADAIVVGAGVIGRTTGSVSLRQG